MLDDRSEAEDAVQDATIKAWRKFPTLRQVEAMRPWFFAIVANECRMARRRRRWSWFGRADTSEDVGVVDPPSAEGVDLRAALGRLNDDRRLAVALRYYLDLPVEEVATATGVPVGTVKSRLHRALRELQTGLTTEDG